jgi:hypothetical protein
MQLEILFGIGKKVKVRRFFEVASCRRSVARSEFRAGNIYMEYEYGGCDIIF